MTEVDARPCYWVMGPSPYPSSQPFTPRRNLKQYPEATEVDGLLLLRIDAALYFANVNPVRLLTLWSLGTAGVIS